VNEEPLGHWELSRRQKKKRKKKKKKKRGISTSNTLLQLNSKHSSSK
jgi:hypothetical protein